MPMITAAGSVLTIADFAVSTISITPVLAVVNVSTGYYVQGSQISAANLSNGTTGTGSIVLSTSPTIASPTVTGSLSVGGSTAALANFSYAGNPYLVVEDLIPTGSPALPAQAYMQASSASSLAGFGSVGSLDVIIAPNTVEKMRVYNAGGVGIGSPTGGSKGNGTLNVASGIYLNGTAYTNPDYVFEKHYTGEIVKFAHNSGAKEYTALTLEQTEAFTRENFQLPRVGDKHELFSRADILLEKVEELYLHIFELNKRIKELESKIA